MSLVELQTTPGTAVPPRPRHAITTHLPTWQAVLDFLDGKPELMMSLKDLYPRMMVHRDITALTKAIAKSADIKEDTGMLLYTSLESAEEQVAFLTDPRRGEKGIPKEELAIRVFKIKDLIYYAVLFPAAKTPNAIPFWQEAGVGVSSRMAEESEKHLDEITEITDNAPALNDWPTEATATLKQRIADLLERAPLGGERDTKVQPSDVYLYQNGMSAIWWTHQYLNGARGTTSAMYGVPFHSTLHVLKWWGAGFKHLGTATEQDLDELQAYCKSEQDAGKPVQAVWAEFPANPMLTVPNLARLRALANTYKFILCIDDTVGSFCNVDLLGPSGADILLTSLTKTFNGYADAMGGSAVLNPLSPRYAELSAVFQSRYHADVAPFDLEHLERNSRTYLSRSARFNANAAALVAFLQSKASDPSSAVKAVLHPSTNPVHRANYVARMRPSNPDFTPGFGCLFSVDFESVQTTIAFYDEVGRWVHISPHLGAHRTLVLCYVKALHGKELDVAEKWGMRETMLRVSVGFEDEEGALLEVFRRGVEKADARKREMEEGGVGGGKVEGVVASLT
jgi:cystathionine gamma-synthase